MVRVSVTALRDALQAVDFPATKDELHDAAVDADANDDVLRALRSLPPVDYGNIGEVISSVTADVGSGLADFQHAERARNKRDQGVAEELRRSEP
jgi:uncharacterized protein DUF2795